MVAGRLVIAGGALDDHGHDIFSRFVDCAGGKGKRFAILPAATEDPVGAVARATEALVSCGVPADCVGAIELSLHRPGWERGAYDSANLARVAAADGIWIPGGDQNAIARLLLEGGSSDTPLLAALRRRLDQGATIGGTSAGAAAMSDPMIGGGTSLGALLLPRAAGPAGTEVSEALWVTRGLGFFPGGIVDQHFDSRARLARLVEAALVEDRAERLAFGIAEDSAMLYDGPSDSIEALGAAGVYVVDARKAVRDGLGGRTRIRGVTLHFLTPGDRMSLRSGAIDRSGKSPIEPGSRSLSVPRPFACGVLSPYGTLADHAGALLMDNGSPDLLVDEERGYPFVRSLIAPDPGAPGDGTIGHGAAGGANAVPAWELRLSRQPGVSSAWYGRGIGFERVIVDILPARLVLERL